MTRENLSWPWPSPHGSGWSRDILDEAGVLRTAKAGLIQRLRIVQSRSQAMFAS